MPQRRIKYKRRRRKRNKVKIGRPSRGLKQSIYYFKRRFTTQVQLTDLTTTGSLYQGSKWWKVPGSISSGVTCGAEVRWQVKLTDLPNNSEFSGGLFQSYKINGMAVKIIPQFNVTSWAQAGADGAGHYAPTQMLCYTMPYNYNRDLPQGTTRTALTENIALETQATKVSTLIASNGKGKNAYHRLKLCQDVVEDAISGVDAVPTLIKPRWLPTDINDVKHYGLSQRIQPVFLTENFQQGQWIKIICTVYLACRGVV